MLTLLATIKSTVNVFQNNRGTNSNKSWITTTNDVCVIMQWNLPTILKNGNDCNTRRHSIVWITCGWHPTTMKMNTPCSALMRSVTYQTDWGPPTIQEMISATHVTPITTTSFRQTRPNAALEYFGWKLEMNYFLRRKLLIIARMWDGFVSWCMDRF